MFISYNRIPDIWLFLLHCLIYIFYFFHLQPNILFKVGHIFTCRRWLNRPKPTKKREFTELRSLKHCNSYVGFRDNIKLNQGRELVSAQWVRSAISCSACETETSASLWQVQVVHKHLDDK